MSSLYDHLKKLEDKKGKENILPNLQEIYSREKNNKIPFLLSIFLVVFLIFSASITLFFYPDLLEKLSNKKMEVVKIKKIEPPLQNIAHNNADMKKQQEYQEKSDNKTLINVKYPETDKKIEINNKAKLASAEQFKKNEVDYEVSVSEALPTKEKKNEAQILHRDVINQKIIDASGKKDVIDDHSKNILISEKKYEKSRKIDDVALKHDDGLMEQKKITDAKKIVLEHTSADEDRIEKFSRKKRLLEHAENLRLKKDFKGASEIYEKVWNEYQDTNVANNLGASLIVLGNYKKALLIFEQALRINPDDEELLFNYNFLKDKLGRE